MYHIKIFINLTRLNKPIGIMLLFWPCTWGLSYAYIEEQNLNQFLYYFFLFFLGSVLMRSAGCIINDVVDKDIDKKVLRTKNRPLASDLITVKLALTYVVILCALAFFILIQFNTLTIILGFASMFLAFSYPFMKRITYWPQLFLGLTFNWGVVMSWTAMGNSISSKIITLYMVAIFWTLGYDTIYGAQDIKDDEIIGIKSTSVKFKKNIKLFVSICYFLSSFLIISLFYDQFGLNSFTLLIIIFILSLMYQVIKFKKTVPEKCLQAFKLNNLSGFLMFLGIFLSNTRII